MGSFPIVLFYPGLDQLTDLVQAVKDVCAEDLPPLGRFARVVGASDDLERTTSEHNSGRVNGYSIELTDFVVQIESIIDQKKSRPAWSQEAEAFVTKAFEGRIAKSIHLECRAHSAGVGQKQSGNEEEWPPRHNKLL